MKRLLLGVLLLPAITFAARADDPPKTQEEKKPLTPAEEYKAVVADFNKANKEFSEAYQKAKTDEERNKAFEDKYPKIDKFCERMMELAKKNPKDGAAIDALVWVVTHRGSQVDDAVDLFIKDHIESPKLDVMSLGYSQSARTEKQLRTLNEKSPHKDVQGKACYALAMHLRYTGHAKEAETEFERVVKDFSDIKAYRDTLGEMAKHDLFELRFLIVGKTAPEIKGEDIDGKKFKLSDYKGKVVLLDFWGDW